MTGSRWQVHDVLEFSCFNHSERQVFNYASALSLQTCGLLHTAQGAGVGWDGHFTDAGYELGSRTQWLRLARQGRLGALRVVLSLRYALARHWPRSVATWCT
jgi:hypothetical protein